MKEIELLDRIVDVVLKYHPIRKARKRPHNNRKRKINGIKRTKG